MPETNVIGRVRNLLEAIASYPAESQRQIALNEQLEQLIAQGAAPYEEITRTGRSFEINTSTAVASLIALPTSAVTLALYNGAPDGGRSLVIDRVWALFTVNSAALPHAGIIANLGYTRAAAPTNSALIPRALNGMHGGPGGGAGGGTLDTVALSIIGGTALDAVTGLAANWFPLGDSVNAAVTSLPGFQKEVKVEGRIIVPPGRYFAVHTLGSVVTSSAQMGIEWHEKQLTLG